MFVTQVQYFPVCVFGELLFALGHETYSSVMYVDVSLTGALCVAEYVRR